MHGSRRAKVWSSPLWAVGSQVNINGLLNAHDVADVIAHECPSVNADSIIDLYKAALEKHPEAESIYIITDNARHYLSKKLRQWVEDTKIKQIFLPPYSPNLNLIERLWKFLRKNIINTKFYQTKHEFETRCSNSLTTLLVIGCKLESLLTLNFRMLNLQFIFDWLYQLAHRRKQLALRY